MSLISDIFTARNKVLQVQDIGIEISSVVNSTAARINQFLHRNDQNPNTSMLADFMAQAANMGGFARPNKYRVLIFTAPLITNPIGAEWFSRLNVSDSREMAQRLQFFCEGAELPGKSFATTDQRHYGPTYKVPYQTTYPDIKFIFNVGLDMKEKSFFDAWSFTVENPETHDYSYSSDYTTTIEIDQVSDFNVDQASYGITLINAWPINVEMLPLGYGRNDEVHKLGVTFTYKRWIPTFAHIKVTDQHASGSGQEASSLNDLIQQG